MNRTDSSLNTSYSKATTDEEDYILKKNLLKCQADLARSEEENAILHKQVYSLKKQVWDIVPSFCNNEMNRKSEIYNDSEEPISIRTVK